MNDTQAITRIQDDPSIKRNILAKSPTIVDYTSEGFLVPLIKGNIQTYAFVHGVMSYDMETTGTYFVYLLHPDFGSSHFNMEKEIDEDGLSERWISEDAPFFIDYLLISTIGEAISEREAAQN
jgi:hypothetical protein